MNRTIQAFFYLLSILGLASIVIFLDIPDHTRFWMELYTAGHTVVFGLCALAFFRLSQLVQSFSNWKRLAHYLIAFVLALAVGALTEVIQPYVGRDATLGDFYRDMLGAIAFLLGAISFDRQLTWEFRTGRGVRNLVRVAAPILILLIFLPALKWGGAYLYRDRQMPILFRFDSAIMRLFARVTNGHIELSDPPAQSTLGPGKVARLTFLPATYPGITLRELTPDWSLFRELAFSLYSPSSDSFSLEFRVSDRRHNEKYNDRFNTLLKIVPGENRFIFPLDRIRHAPLGRLMDLTDMGTIVLFTRRPVDSFSIYISDFRLQ